jgi:hypothetical protein
MGKTAERLAILPKSPTPNILGAGSNLTCLKSISCGRTRILLMDFSCAPDNAAAKVNLPSQARLHDRFLKALVFGVAEKQKKNGRPVFRRHILARFTFAQRRKGQEGSRLCPHSATGTFLPSAGR